MDHGTDQYRMNAACKDVSNKDASIKDKTLCTEHKDKVTCTDRNHAKVFGDFEQHRK